MPDDRLTRVIEMFRSRGNISDDVEGDVRLTSKAWLDASDVFSSVHASTMTATRNKLEYLDIDTSTEVTEEDARWAVQLATRAVTDASSFVT